MPFLLSICSALLRSVKRLLTRSIGFILISIFGLFSIAYLTYCLPTSSSQGSRRASLPFQLGSSRLRKSGGLHLLESPRRLVAFGDAWSDNGHYLIDPPLPDQVIPRDARQGQVWTDWLCAATSCLYHDNFARPNLLSSSRSELRGAVIDNSLLNSTLVAKKHFRRPSMFHEIDFSDPVPDFKGQIQQWLAFEKTQYGDVRSKEAEKRRTVFTVWFSNWELWYYSGTVYAHAQSAITKSIDTLFEQLDLVAENWTLRPNIIILNAVDLTFLPSWRTKRTGPDGVDPLAEDQRNAVGLVEQWNLALKKRASAWNKGRIYLHDANDWFLDQLRQHQIHKATQSSASDRGSEPSQWRNVRVGCLGSNDDSSEVMQNNGKEIRCSEPSSYLFWDEIHFGSSAMRMLGESIFAEITGNRRPGNQGE